MGRHTKLEPPDDEPVPDAGTTQGPFYGAPPGSSFDAFSGPTDDRVYVSPHDRISTGPPPEAERRHGPPAEPRFDPLPGDYPGDYPGAPDPSSASGSGPPPDRHPDPARPPGTRPGTSGGHGPLKFFSALPVPLLPIFALVIAVGIVAYALSTQQISLNFAGGAPRETLSNPRDSQVSQRGPGDRASRGAGRSDGLIIAFRVASKTPGGFKATATIANKGARPVARWALAFKIPNVSVTAVSGADVVKTGTVAFVRGRAGIAPGETVRIAFTARGTARRPSSCILNNRPCAIV